MTKEEVKALIDLQSQALKDAVDSIEGSSNEELLAQIAALTAELASKNEELAGVQGQLSVKEAELVSAKDLLAQADAKAKELDALIPDGE